MKRMIVAMLVLVAMLSAAFVPVDRAKKVAENYYKNYAPTAQKGNVITRTVAKKYNGEVTYYAFEFGNQNGFILVNGDDALRTILGWSFDSGLCSEEDFYNMKNPFANRMEFADKQIVEARKTKYVDAEAQKTWKDYENNVFTSTTKAIVVPALVQSRWGQDYPYNLACPTDNAVRTVNGCVALAMSQVIRYHQGPATPTGSHTYMWTGAYSSGTQTVDYTASTYDFALMPLTTAGYTLATQRNEVSELCYEAGVAVNMDYGTTISPAVGSGAYTMDVPAALEDHFEFATAANYVTVGTVTLETAQATTINTDLGNARPIIWSGSGTDGGHCFVLDGRTNDYQYHFNWGWEGYMDGWYKLNNLNPGSNFTSSQGAVYQLYCNENAFANWPAPTGTAAAVSGDDITVTWTRPAGVKLGTLTGYKLFRNDVQIATPAAGATSYALDINMPAGVYNYYISATYTTPDGESHYSTNGSATVAENTTYPNAYAVSAATMGRTSIDVTWHKPFIGTIYISDGFEDGSISDWTQKSHAVWGSAKAWTNATTAWKVADAAGWPDAAAAGVHSGTYSMGCIWNTALTAWSIYSPAFTTASGATLSYYVWYENATYPTVVYSGLYGGTWAETKWATILANMQVVDTLDTAAEVDYMTKAQTFITTKTGSNRIFFWYNYNDGWEFIVDDIVMGYGNKSEFTVNDEPTTNGPVRRVTERAARPDDRNVVNRTDLPNDQIMNYTSPKGTIQPDGYNIYRNGVLATYIARSGVEQTWSDTGFADGWNEYYVVCKYTNGGTFYSNASTRGYDYIIANPAPDYLEGVLNANQKDVNLSWYAPLHMPPHWFGMVDGSYEASFDQIETMTGNWMKRRTIYTYGGTGMPYPWTVDSVAAAFYEDTAAPWLQSTFKFKLNTSNYAGTADSTIYYGSNLTAVSDAYTTLALPTQKTMNWGFYVTIIPSDSVDGTPSSLVDVHALTAESYSSTYYGGDGTNTAGWYGISFGTDGAPGDWAIIVFGQGSVDTWYQNKNNASERLAITPTKTVKADLFDANSTLGASKALANYKIYRNGTSIGTLTSAASPATYTDVNAPAGDNTYYITAAYTSPVGESTGSNSVIVTVPNQTVIPAVPTGLTTALVSGNVYINWNDAADATSYDVYSSALPYGTFTLLTNVAVSEYTYSAVASNAKMFFYVVSKNSTKASPRTIEIARPSAK